MLIYSKSYDTEVPERHGKMWENTAMEASECCAENLKIFIFNQILILT